MDPRIFRAEPMGLREDMLRLPFDARFNYDRDHNILFINLSELTINAPDRREPVDLSQLVQEMIVLLRSEATRNSVAVRLELADDLPKVMADSVQLQQVLINLVLNAIEAMKDRDGELALTIGSQLTADGKVAVSVGDTGVGLPAENLERIFDPFFTTKPQGTGMGLALTRSIVESHGGRVWAVANAGQGATFHFVLPAQIELKSASA